MTIRTLSICFFAVLLSACGGGSDSNSSTLSSTSNLIVNANGVTQPVELTLKINSFFKETINITRNGRFVLYEADFGDTYEVTLDPNTSLSSFCNLDNQGPAIIGSIPSEVTLTCSQPASVTGSLFIEDSYQRDSDINDELSSVTTNNTFATAQEVTSNIKIHGFVSDSRFDVLSGNYTQSPDLVDIYTVELKENDLITLQIFGDSTLSDADIELYDNSQNPVAFSNNIAQDTELLSIPSDGTYFIAVSAFQSASRYILTTISNSVSSHNYGSIEDIIAGQAVITMASDAKTMRTSAAPLKASIKHFDLTRSTLAKLDDSEQALSDFERELLTKNPEGFAIRKTLSDIKRLSLREDISHAAPNYRVKALALPNDPLVSSQWHYSKINLPQAWDEETGLSSSVTVAVVDTGVWLNHEDFVGTFVDGYDFISDTFLSLDGNGIDNNPDDPGDQSFPDGSSSWHGTHVAGTIASNTNNNIGVAGVSWGANIMPLRALGLSGQGSTYDIMQSVRYAAGLSNDSNTVPSSPADIINLSLGGGSFSVQDQNTYLDVRLAGTIIIAAAGNEATSSPSYPAAYDGVVSVGATGLFDELANYSNFGNTIDLVAPGGNGSYLVLSNFVSEATGSKASSYDALPGTSMAAPHVAGVAALMKSAYPALTPSDFDQLLNNGELTQDLGAAGWDPLFGHGRIDAYKAVLAAKELGSPLDPNQVRLTLNTSQLNLNTRNELAFIEISNLGKPTSITSTGTGDIWLSITPDSIDANGLGRYQVNLDSSQLTAGQYRSFIEFQETDGNVIRANVFVSIQSDLSGALQAPVYVLLYDIYSGVTIAETVAEQSSGSTYTFAFDEVPTGTYEVIAGSDIDQNFFICENAESCGVYPVLSDSELVTVTESGVSGLDFGLQLLNANLASSANESNVQNGSSNAHSRAVKRIDQQ